MICPNPSCTQKLHYKAEFCPRCGLKVAGRKSFYARQKTSKLGDVIRNAGGDTHAIGLLLILFVDAVHPEIVPEFEELVNKSFGEKTNDDD